MFEESRSVGIEQTLITQLIEQSTLGNVPVLLGLLQITEAFFVLLEGAPFSSTETRDWHDAHAHLLGAILAHLREHVDGKQAFQAHRRVDSSP